MTSKEEKQATRDHQEAVVRMFITKRLPDTPAKDLGSIARLNDKTLDRLTTAICLVDPKPE